MERYIFVEARDAEWTISQLNNMTIEVIMRCGMDQISIAEACGLDTKNEYEVRDLVWARWSLHSYCWIEIWLIQHFIARCTEFLSMCKQQGQVYNWWELELWPRTTHSLKVHHCHLESSATLGYQPFESLNQSQPPVTHYKNNQHGKAVDWYQWCQRLTRIDDLHLCQWIMVHIGQFPRTSTLAAGQSLHPYRLSSGILFILEIHPIHAAMAQWDRQYLDSFVARSFEHTFCHEALLLTQLSIQICRLFRYLGHGMFLFWSRDWSDSVWFLSYRV